MKIRVSMAAVAVTALLGGCATRANSVAPVAVASTDYSGMNCTNAREELLVARQKENALVRRQNNAAVADAAGVFLVFLPLGSVFGADVAGELAQAKGETLALERHIRVNCGESALRGVPAAEPLAAAPAVPAPAQAAPTPASTAPTKPAPATAAKKNCGIRSVTNPDAVICPTR
jgi:hypothetical protein